MIPNASNLSLEENPSTLPNMALGMENWFQPMIFGIISKSTIDFKVVETLINVEFKGVLQPMGPEKLIIKPEGQKSLVWWTLHAEVDLVLKADEIVTYFSKNYRVMDKFDYTKYGYVEYHLCEDYEFDSGVP